MDPKAKRILFKTFWRNGWLEDSERVTSAEDFAYAKAHGLMFDPVTWGHDDCVEALQTFRRPEFASEVGKGLLASLSTRRVDLRSAAASWACVQDLRPHTYEHVQIGSFWDQSGMERPHLTCRICLDAGVTGIDPEPREMDVNVLSFERVKWGGVRHHHLDYERFDLEAFRRTPPADPTAEDYALMAALFDTINSIDPNATASVLVRALKVVVPGTVAELRALVEILGAAGVLRPKASGRPEHTRSDWNIAGQWRGSDGYDQTRAQQLFGRR